MVRITDDRFAPQPRRDALTMPAPEYPGLPAGLTRADHLAVAKARALHELEHGAGGTAALASMASDCGKHPDLADHPGNHLGMMLAVTGHLGDPAKVRDHIEGYN